MILQELTVILILFLLMRIQGYSEQYQSPVKAIENRTTVFIK
jgi:hypothetical protein